MSTVLAAGLVAGGGEVILRIVQIEVLDARIWLGRDFIWMAPLGAALVLLAGGGVLAAIAMIRRRPLPAALVFGTCAFLILLGPLLTVGRIHPLAALLLAAGVGAQLGHLLRRQAGRIVRGAPTVAFVLVAAAALTAFGTGLRTRVGEERALTALPAPPADATNVLLIILDTVRASDLGLYGLRAPTSPSLDRLGAAGTVFEHAWSPSPWTLPAHSTLFTGRYPHELCAGWKVPLEASVPTLAEAFRARGYATGGFTANLIYTTRETGIARGFVRYEDYPRSLEMVIHSSLVSRRVIGRLGAWLGRVDKPVRKHATEVVDQTLTWMRETERPFFAFVNLFDAHAPYLPPDTLAGRFGPQRAGRPLHDLSNRRTWTAEAIAAERAAYRGAIAYVDQELGRLFAEMERLGLLDRTLVVLTADHGELFGEHGLMDHGNSLYRPLLEVPLILHYPGVVPAGRRIPQPVSLRDVPATVADLAGLPAGAFPGASLTPAWADGRSWQPSPLLAEIRQGIRTAPWLPHSAGDMASLLSGGLYYIRDGNHEVAVYDVVRDPEERNNLAVQAAYADTTLAMGRRLDSLRAVGSRCPAPAQAGPDE